MRSPREIKIAIGVRDRKRRGPILLKKGTERTSLSVTCTHTTPRNGRIDSFCFEGKLHDRKVYGRNSLGGDDLCCRGEKHSSFTFTAQQSLEKHRTGRSAKLEAGERFIFRKETAKPRKGYGDWLLPARVSSRSRRTSDNRADLAGNAAVT
jgi:hypothetical protein